jgi:hypothetical protein
MSQRLRDSILTGFRTIERRPTLGVALMGLAGLMGSMLTALLTAVPVPVVHDEFAYLLAGDTFASGRLTNPTHPLWHHFETFHVFFEPTYAAKYPPAQGLILAMGQLIGGHPVLGVWISIGVMCAAITWMLLAWFPPRWAFLGGALALLQLGIVSYWAQSYWGGAVAATGGALLFGSLRRILDRPRFLPGILLGVGVAILAASRPMEGLIATLPAAGLIFYRLVVPSVSIPRVPLLKAVLPALIIVAAGLGWLGYLNWRTTGEVTRMPYQVHEAAYASAPSFLWERPAAPTIEYRHREIERYWREWGRERHLAQQSVSAFLPATVGKLVYLLYFFLGAGALALVLLPQVLRDRWMVFAGTVGLAVMGVSFFTKGTYPHYVAPATGLLVALLVQSLRALSGRDRIWRYTGSNLVRVILASALLSTAVLVGVRAASDSKATLDFGRERERLLSKLEQDGNEHLVIVRYGPGHNVHREWVYNRANIDAASVVWARDMGEQKNRTLLEYYEAREVWLLEVDTTAVLKPYPR